MVIVIGQFWHRRETDHITGLCVAWTLQETRMLHILALPVDRHHESLFSGAGSTGLRAHHHPHPKKLQPCH